MTGRWMIGLFRFVFLPDRSNGEVTDTSPLRITTLVLRICPGRGLAAGSHPDNKSGEGYG